MRRRQRPSRSAPAQRRCREFVIRAQPIKLIPSKHLLTRHQTLSSVGAVALRQRGARNGRHRRYWSQEHSRAVYDSCEEYLTEIRDFIREVVDKLVSLGCDYIQLDAPNYGSLCDPDTRAAMADDGHDLDAELAFDAELDSSLCAGLTGVTTAMHVCRGNGPGGRVAFGRRLRGDLRGAVPEAGAQPAAAGVRLRPGGHVRAARGRPRRHGGGARPAHHEVRPAGRRVRGGRADCRGGALQTAGGVGAQHPVRVRVGPVANPATPEVQRAKLEMVVRLARRTWP
jgi:hypothetical protein